MATIKETERRLAVVTTWSLLGSFGLGCLLSGFHSDNLLIGLAGFVTLMGSFVAHIVINRIYGGGFRAGEIAAAFIAFGIAVLGFLTGWLFDPAFSVTDARLGLMGFSALIVSFLAYLVTKHGIRRRFSMFHQTHNR